MQKWRERWEKEKKQRIIEQIVAAIVDNNDYVNQR